MKVNTKEFRTEWDWVKRFVEEKTTIPILANIALAAGRGRLSLIATDLETSGFTSIGADGPDTWTIVAPAEIVSKYLHKITEPTCDVEPLEGFGLRITHGDDGAEALFDGMSMESFPQLPTVKATVRLRGLDVAIPRVLISVSPEESRFTLNGAKLVVDTKRDISALISTDGHRLSYVEVDATKRKDISTLIRKKALAGVLKIGSDGSCMFGADDQNQCFVSGCRMIIARKLTGSFPDYERVIPSKTAHRVTMDTAALAKIIDRVELFADERSHGIQFDIEKGSVTVSAKTLERGSGKGVLPAPGCNGTVWKSGWTAPYIKDFLRLNESAETVMEFNDMKADGHGRFCNHDASVFVTDGWKYVVMPQRI